MSSYAGLNLQASDFFEGLTNRFLDGAVQNNRQPQKPQNMGPEGPLYIQGGGIVGLLYGVPLLSSLTLPSPPSSYPAEFTK